LITHPLSCICVWRLRWHTGARNMWEVVPMSYLYWCLEDFLLFSIYVVIWLACMSITLYCNFTLIVLVGGIQGFLYYVTYLFNCRIQPWQLWRCFYVFDGSLFFLLKNWTFLFGKMGMLVFWNHWNYIIQNKQRQSPFHVLQKLSNFYLSLQAIWNLENSELMHYF